MGGWAGEAGTKGGQDKALVSGRGPSARSLVLHTHPVGMRFVWNNTRLVRISDFIWKLTREPDPQRAAQVNAG